ncbi:MAG: hypothetical protein ACSHW1_12985 [Yoonia sp.]|uniref:hypothetical protein n=1 Tax=Yoonia sp. TaxID=2212373 RepID=UPI003EF3A584
MTALDRYVRLESDALWRASPDAQRRDVTIAFGDATLVISDNAGRPLAHWSLPALIRQNNSDTPAIYAPDDDASELLEISDPTMIGAIEEVRKALAKSQPHPGKLRYLLTAGLIAITLLLAIFWLPGALTRQTLAVVPLPKRIEIGTAMLGYMEPLTGPACRATRAEDAATRFAQRLFGSDTAARIVVVPKLDQNALALPGGLIVVGRDILEGTDDPAAVAGYILASRAAIQHSDPLENLLVQEGLRTTFNLLTTGVIAPTILNQNAQNLVTGAAPQPRPAVLRRMMADALIPQAPYRAAADRRSGNTPDLGDDPLAGETVPLILSDSDWVALQNICND